MSVYERCPKEIEDIAAELLCKYPEHKPLLDARVKIDFVFAYAGDQPGSVAIRHHGIRALGLCRRLGLKDRAKGQGDAEIILDADWWQKATADEARALLDHELHHLSIVTDKHGRIQWDDLRRPKLKLRPHDLEFGWFLEMARRHGAASQERIQAKTVMDAGGQWLWPDLVEPEATIELSTGGQSTGPMPLSKFEAAAKAIQKKTYRLKKS